MDQDYNFDDKNFQVSKNPGDFGYLLHIGVKTLDRSKFFIAKPIEFKEHTPGEAVNPCMTLRDSEIQGIMDSLWASGVRPTSGEGNPGQLGATERHLDDMRQIAFDQLSITKPENVK